MALQIPLLKTHDTSIGLLCPLPEIHHQKKNVRPQATSTSSNKAMEEIPPFLSTLRYQKLEDPDYFGDPSAEKQVPEFLADEIE